MVLLKLNDEPDLDKKCKLLEDMRRFKSYKQKNPIELASAQYLSNWLHVAVREFSYCKGFQLNAKWISEKMVSNISQKEIDSALKFLTEYQFIEVDKDGSVQLKNQPIECRGEALVPSLAQFHTQVLKLAIESIGLVPSEERRITGHTQLLNAEAAQEAMAILQEAEKKIVELSRRTQTNEGRVYHFAFVGFPLTD